ncbi:unnamed protein product [Amoebophrya sp. A25]|nr:unnamed protein product [Amoebophrya sp. A25]|eukprot:GSA25T00012122001.1
MQFFTGALGTPRSGASVWSIPGTPRGGSACMPSTPRGGGPSCGAVGPTLVRSGSTSSLLGTMTPRPSCLLHNLPISSSSGFNIYLRPKSTPRVPKIEEEPPKKKEKKMTLKNLVKLTMLFTPKIKLYVRFVDYSGGTLSENQASLVVLCDLLREKVSAREGELRTVGDIVRIIRTQLQRNVDNYYRTLQNLFPQSQKSGRATYGIYSARVEDLEDEDAGVGYAEEDSDDNAGRRAASQVAAGADPEQDVATIGVFAPTIRLTYVTSANEVANFDLSAVCPRRGRPPMKLNLASYTYYPWNKQVTRHKSEQLPHPPGSKKILFETPKKKSILVTFLQETDWEEIQQLLRFLFDKQAAKHQKQLKETSRTFAETYFTEKLQRESRVTLELLKLSQNLLDALEAGKMRLACDDKPPQMVGEKQGKLGDNAYMQENIRGIIDAFIKSGREMPWDVSLSPASK